MTYLGMLNTTVAISRFTSAATDDYGQPTGTWATSATVVGRLVPSGGREIETDKAVVISTHKLFLESGVSITEADRVVIGSDTFNVLLVKDAAGAGHHIECDLERVE